jgi:AcrR family transcriptional regulator
MSQLPEKVLLLYQAMQELVGEGVDLSTVKVSAITERAGIGKGTAYDYFESKDDLVASSLVFLVGQTILELRCAIQDKHTLYEQLNSLLVELGEKIKVRAGLLHFVNMLTDFSPISQLFRDKLIQETNAQVKPIEMIDEMLSAAAKRGEIKEVFPKDYMILSVCSRIITYITFQTIQEDLAQVGLFQTAATTPLAASRREDEMRQFICESVIREFQ